MALRLAHVFAAAFFLAMNVLLWRAEFGGGRHAGGSIPSARVAELILNAPDESPLALLRHGERLGSLRWHPQVIEEPPAGGFAPEGFARARRGWKLNFDGNLFGEAAGLRLRYSGHVTLAPDRGWKDLQFRAGARPLYVEVAADAAERRLRLAREDGGGRETFHYTFEQLRQPQRVLADLGLGWLALLGPGARLPDLQAAAAAVEAEAGLDWLRVGEARLRVYRLTVRLPERQQAVLYVSRAGEILKAQLPGQISLIHDSLVP